MTLSTEHEALLEEMDELEMEILLLERTGEDPVLLRRLNKKLDRMEKDYERTYGRKL